MAKFLPFALAFAVVLYAFIDVVLTPRGLSRTMPKLVWLLVVVLVPLVGAIGWFLLGRPRAAAGDAGGSSRGRAPRAPDDDPAFLDQLDSQTWSQRMRRRRESEPEPDPDAP